MLYIVNDCGPAAWLRCGSDWKATVMDTRRKVILIQPPITSSAIAQETVHREAVKKNREEGFENSHAMEDLSWLTDVFGPCVSRSPSYVAAAGWAKE